MLVQKKRVAARSNFSKSQQYTETVLNNKEMKNNFRVVLKIIILFSLISFLEGRIAHLLHITFSKQPILKQN